MAAFVIIALVAVLILGVVLKLAKIAIFIALGVGAVMIGRKLIEQRRLK